MPEYAPQIRFVELLEDPIYSAWFNRHPSHQSRARLAGNRSFSWRVYAQTGENGRWGSKNFKSWKKGRKWLLKNHSRFWDAALCCVNHEFSPPVVRDKKTGERRKHGAVTNRIGHRWCGYCRRPTVFKSFRRHHVLGRVYSTQLRCTICGMRELNLKR